MRVKNLKKRVVVLLLAIAIMVHTLSLETLAAFVHTASGNSLSQNEIVPSQKDESRQSVSNNETQTNESTLSENELSLDTLSQNTVSANQVQASPLSEEAFRAFEELIDLKDIMALIYLRDYYEVKREPKFQAETSITLQSGSTVHIIGIEITDEAIWYQIAFWQEDGLTAEGYVEKDYLAYSDEDLIAWEAKYLNDILPKYMSKTRMSILADVEQFPASYKTNLYILKEKHPNWKFVKYQPNVDWNRAVTEQLKDGRSLVWYSSPEEWKNGKYYNKGVYDNNWYYATKLAIEKFMDPRNSLTESYIFQHEQLTYNASYHTEAAVQQIIQKTFMSGKIPEDELGRTYANAFFNIGKRTTVSPFHLASRVRQEQGAGTSPLISGTYPGYEGYYNYFNIGATGSGSQVIVNGLAKAKAEGWNTRYKSLDKGADFIGNNYIKVGQDTLYLQKFDLVGTLFTHQYMQNIQAPNTEGQSTKNGYAASGNIDSSFVFKIPVYENMPQSGNGIPLANIYLDKTQKRLLKNETETLKLSYLPLDTTVDKRVTWTSSNANVVKVEKTTSEDTAKIIAVGSGIATITAKMSNKTVNCRVQVLAFNPEEKILSKGNSETISVPYEAIASDGNQKIVWSSSNPNIINIEETEKAGTANITALSGGMATITASINGQKTTCKIQVLELNEIEKIVIKGQQDILKLSYVQAETTDNKGVTWTSSNPEIVRVEKTDKEEVANIQAIGNGIATITAAVGNKKVSCKVQGISLSHTKKNLDKGEEEYLKLNYQPMQITQQEKVQWTTSDEKVIQLVKAELEQDILLKAVGKGNATVTASINGKKMTCDIEVQNPVETIILSDSKITISPGEEKQITAKISPADANVNTVNWKSLDETIATVDENGLITGMEYGTTRILASAGGKQAYCSVEVLETEDIEVIELSKSEINVITGNEVDLSIIKISNPDNLGSVIWTASSDSLGLNTLSVVKSDNTEKIYVTDNNNKKILSKEGDTITAIGESEISTIYLWANDGDTKTKCKIKVYVLPERIEWNGGAEGKNLKQGDTLVLGVDIFPLHADKMQLTWNSSNPNVATVEQTEYGKAEIKAIGVGSTSISVTTPVGMTLVKKIIVTENRKIADMNLNNEAIELVLGEEGIALEAYVKLEGEDAFLETQNVKWISGKAAIAEVNEKTGEVTAKSAGTTEIYAFEQSGSGKYEVCAVKVTKPAGYVVPKQDKNYPIDKAFKLSAVNPTLKLQGYANNTSSSVQVIVKDQFGNYIDKDFFTYTTSNASVAVVDAQGRVIPSPRMTSTAAKTVTITASLKNDIGNRKVNFSVTVYPTMQVENIVLSKVEENGKWMVSAKQLDMNGLELATNVKWSVSDSSLASIKDNRNNTCTVTIKKPGKFYVMATANDGYKKMEKIQLGEPDLTPKVLGTALTVNKQEESGESTPFELVIADGIVLSDVIIKEVSLGRNFLSEEEKQNFETIVHSNNKYTFKMDKEWIRIQKDNTTFKMVVSITAGSKEYEQLITIKIINKKPTVVTPVISIDRQYSNNLSALAQITSANGKIVQIKAVEGQKNNFDKYFTYVKRDGIWYLTFADNEGTYKASSISGKVWITVEGYQPIEKSVTIKTPLTLPSLIANATPNIDTRYGIKATVSLLNSKTKEKLTGYTIVGQESNHLNASMEGEGTSGNITLAIKEGASYKNGTTLVSKVYIQKEEWAKPVLVNLKMKVYTTTQPKVSLQLSALTLNKQLPLEQASTTIHKDRANVGIQNRKQWEIYRYNSSTRKYDILCDETENIQIAYNRLEGKLYASFSGDISAVAKGTYKYQIKNVLNGYEDAALMLSVNVLDNGIKASAKVSGKIDLLNRRNTALNVSLSYTNTKANALSVTSLDNNFYAVFQENNRFLLKAKENVALTTAKLTVPVRIVMEGGSVLQTGVTFTPTQSNPKIKTPDTITMYKNKASEIKEINIKDGIAPEITLHHLEQIENNNDFGIILNGSTISIKLLNDAIKPGTYTLKVKVYFKDAKAEFGYPYGKGSAISIRIKVI